MKPVYVEWCGHVMGITIKVPWISYNYTNSATAHIFAEFLYTLWNSITVWYDIESKRKTCNAGKEPPSLFLVGQKKSNTNEPQIIKSIFCSIDIRSFCIYPLMQESKASVVPQPKALTPVMAPTTTTAASCLLLGYRSPAWRNAESRHPSSSIWEHLVSEGKKEMKGRIWQWSIIRSF